LLSVKPLHPIYQSVKGFYLNSNPLLSKICDFLKWRTAGHNSWTFCIQLHNWMAMQYHSFALVLQVKQSAFLHRKHVAHVNYSVQAVIEFGISQSTTNHTEHPSVRAHERQWSSKRTTQHSFSITSFLKTFLTNEKHVLLNSTH
jgi:hypothetical protein